MSDTSEYSELPLDFATFINNKMSLKKAMGNTSPCGFDPYQAMINKKKLEAGEISELPVTKWPTQDVKALEDFCSKNGIVGFNSGRMSPIAALAFLKNKMGIVDSTLEERIPYGYMKMKENNKTSILHG